MEEIIAKGPWSFNKRLSLQKRFHGDTSPSDVKFQNAQFWICVFNIPIKSMNREIGSRLANEIGDLVTVDVPRIGLGWGPFLRIRVNIEITKPLISMRGKILRIEGLSVDWVCFQYRRIPIFCYRCGILSHNVPKEKQSGCRRSMGIFNTDIGCEQ